MFCSQCGTEAPDESVICLNFGAQAEQPCGAIADSELESQAARGDREAFAELYKRHFDRVYDFLRRMVRDADEAADLAQETFLRALRALSPKEKKAAFSTWLFTIARNLALKRLERQRRIAVEPEQQGDEEEPIVYRQVDTARFADPLEAAQAQELSGLVWQAAAGLNPKEYSLLDLHVRQGFESAEIAQVLGMSKWNAYTMMSRLKDTLESAVAALQLLQRGRKECDGLNRLLEEQRITFISPDARRIIDRHVAQCPICQEQRRRLVSPTAIFGSFAAVPVPFGLKPRIGEALMGSWAEAGSEAVGGLKGLLSQGAAKVGSLPTAWKAAIIAGLLVGAVGGGLGGWIGAGGDFPGMSNGTEPTPVVPAVLPPSPEPSPTVEPTPTATPSDTEFTELIAYIGKDGNVWTINPDGANARQITTDGDNAQPAWSPDGKKLAYIHNRRYVYLAEADGSGYERVAVRAGCANPFENQESLELRPVRLTRIQFTPDGDAVRLGIDWGGIINQFICHQPLDASTPALPTVNGDEFGINPKDGSIAFTQSGQGCAWMYIADANGGNRRQIGPTMGVGCTIEPEELSVLPYAPTWSPDGETIAFYGVDGARTSRVYTLDPSDAASAQLMVEAGQVQNLQEGVLGLAWLPDGEFLAYEKDGGVWVLEMDTGATRRLVDGTNPAWGRVPGEPAPATGLQPTGGILFASHRDGQSALYLMRPDGTDVRRLDKLPTSEFPSLHFALSPDGTKIAFRMVGGQAADPVQVDVVDLATQDVMSVTLPRLASFTGWYPDGIKLVYSDSSGIYIRALDGSGSTRITDNGGSLMWSPYGSKLTLVRTVGQHPENPARDDTELFVVNSDGTGLKNLSQSVEADVYLVHTPFALGPSYGGGYDWSPDGQEIVFWSFRDPPGLYSANVNTGNVRFLASGALPAWSPSGEAIAFVRDPEGFNDLASVYTISSDGRSETLVSDVTPYYIRGAGNVQCVGPPLEWSPDGSMLLAGVTRGGCSAEAEREALEGPLRGEIVVVDVESGVTTNLTDHEGSDYFATWVTEETYQRLLGFEEPAPTPVPATYADPFAYCAAVGTVDAPDSQWAGPTVPNSVIEFFVEEQYGGNEYWRDASFYTWRCFEGKLWGCSVGANLHCGKADTSREPTSRMIEECQKNPDIGLPFAVTGHANIYIWECQGGVPVIVDQWVHVDLRGFISEWWYEIQA